MKISEIVSLLDAVVCYGDQFLNREVKKGAGFDLMSDVLAFAETQSVMLTGLLNPQVIRTAEMMDVSCLIFVRGKKPTKEMINLAENGIIPLISTEKSMFESCGILYAAGLESGVDIHGK